MKNSRNSSLVTVLIATMLPLALQAPDARAAGLHPDSYRVGKVIDKFDDTWQFAASFKLGRPRRLLAQYMDLTLGVITASGESRPFVSLAPVWQTPVFGGNISIKFSFGYDFGY